MIFKQMLLGKLKNKKGMEFTIPFAFLLGLTELWHVVEVGFNCLF